MTSPRGLATATGWVIGAAVVAFGGTAIAGSALDLLYERTLMTAADQRCRLFEPAVGAALDASRAQARGASLRSGAGSAAVGDTERRARSRAAATPCGSKDMTVAADRVRLAFKGYAKLSRMTWPGDTADWRGDRTVTRKGPLWRLSQAASFGPDRMIFGLAGEEAPGTLQTAAAFADGRTPYAARLVLRDVARAPEPYLNRGRAGPGGKLPLQARTPPPGATRAITADARSEAPERLRPAGTRRALLFRFPARAVDALAGLDPREAVAVEFVFSGPRGDEVRRAYIEVGDFAAGRAFVRIPVL